MKKILFPISLLFCCFLQAQSQQIEKINKQMEKSIAT